MATAPSDGAADARDTGPSTWTWLLPALAFLAGAALSALLFVVGDSDDGRQLGADGSDAAPGTASPTPSPLPEGELVLQVPAACVEAAELAETVTTALSDVVQAAGSLDARRLQEALDVVQQIRPEVEETSQECRDIAAQGTIVVPSESPSPSPSPSGSPSPTASPSASDAG